MRTILLIAAIIPTFAFAQVKVQKDVICDTLDKVVLVLQDTHGEKPIWLGQSNNVHYGITANPKTSSWTILQFSTKENIACVLGTGEGFKNLEKTIKFSKPL